MEQILWILGAFFVAIGVVVTFHEFGHFWVARRCGVQVLTFSVGFGKPLWSRVAKDGTRYQIAMVPLGGYVRMLDGRVDTLQPGDEQRSFDHKPISQRIAIVLAGPVFNFIFAFLVLWLVYILGTPSLRPVVGDVAADSVAAQAGLQRGDMIMQIDNRRTPEWQAVNLALVERIGGRESTWLVADLEGQQREVTLDLTQWQFDPDRDSTIGALGMQIYQPRAYNTLAQVLPDSPAERAGLRAGDKIIGIDGTIPMQWEQIRSFIAARPNQNLAVTIERGGEQQDVWVHTDNQSGTGILGVAPETDPVPADYYFNLQYGPLQAIPQSLDRTWQLMTLSVNMIRKLITGDVSVKNLSGPVGIAVGAGDHASYGLVYFLSFLALISVSLGIFNLLPIPMLDGGHLVYYIIEWVRGKPVPEHVQEIGFRVGMIVLFALTALVLFNDITRLTP